MHFIYMRLISDKLYAQVMALLLKDEKVALFQQLAIAEKAEPTDKPDEIKVNEVKNEQ